MMPCPKKEEASGKSRSNTASPSSVLAVTQNCYLPLPFPSAPVPCSRAVLGRVAQTGIGGLCRLVCGVWCVALAGGDDGC